MTPPLERAADRCYVRLLRYVKTHRAEIVAATLNIQEITLNERLDYAQLQQRKLKMLARANACEVSTRERGWV